MALERDFPLISYLEEMYLYGFYFGLSLSTLFAKCESGHVWSRLQPLLKTRVSLSKEVTNSTLVNLP